MDNGVSSHFEFYYAPYDNWVDLHVFPTDEGIACYYRDITDLKGAEYLRDAATRQLQQVLEATTDAVVSVNRDNRFTFLNRRANELLALKRDLLGKNIWEAFLAASSPHLGPQPAGLPALRSAENILLPEYVPIVADLTQKTIATGEMIVVDFPVLAANGDTLWVECRGQALKVDGVPTRLRGLTIDITDRQRNEDALVTSQAPYRILA